MTPQAILAIIAASPSMQALAAAKNWTALASAITAAAPPVVVSKIITARGMAAAYSSGPIACEAVLMKLGTQRASLRSTQLAYANR